MLRWALAPTVLLACSLAASAQVTFTGPGLTIPDMGTAAPSPSVITVSGYTGTITGFTVTLTGLTHDWTSDIGAVVTGPANQRTLLFDGPGDIDNGNQVAGINLIFDDAALITLPDAAAFGSGTFRPGQNGFNDNFTGLGGAAANTFATNFAAFLGQAPDGNYSLYVEDFADPDGGSLVSWSITISGITPVPEPGMCLLAVLGAISLAPKLRRRFKSLSATVTE